MHFLPLVSYNSPLSWEDNEVNPLTYPECRRFRYRFLSTAVIVVDSAMAELKRAKRGDGEATKTKAVVFVSSRRLISEVVFIAIHKNDIKAFSWPNSIHQPTEKQDLTIKYLQTEF